MQRILVDPLNLNLVLVAIAALVSAGYFVRVKDKSAATWYMLGFLVSTAVYSLALAFWAFTHGSIAADASFYSSTPGVAFLIVGAMAGPLLAQAAYHFRVNPFPKEATILLLASTTIVVAAVLLLISRPTLAVGVSRWMVAFWALWGVVVSLRKTRRATGTKWSARENAGMVAVAVFLMVVTINETISGFNLIQGSAPSVGSYIFGQILQFTVVLAFPVVYVQYAPEPTTFQVKLVGFVLLIVLSVFGVIGSYESLMDDHRQTFDPAPRPYTLSLVPVGTAFEVAARDLEFEKDVGEDLGLLDDSKSVVQLPFGFPFAGDTLTAVVVNANGAIEPSETGYGFDNFSGEFPTVTERPLIAPWYTDLNPGAGGNVFANVTSDHLTVTWSDVPEWNYFLPHTIQAILYDNGRIDFNYIDLPFDTYVGASGVLSHPTPGAQAQGTLQTLDDILEAGPIQNPIAIYDRRREFKQYLHGETMPFVWVVLGTIGFILLVAPLFFRLALTRPLEQLLVGMQKVNDGELEAELQVGVKDEFGYLAQNFNQMTKSLRTYSGEMESLVDDRTQELNKSIETLKSTQQQLVQQEKMASLGQLTAGIAHEIKNPLNFVNNFADLNSELADELTEAIENGEDISELISNLKQNAEVIAEHGKRADAIVRSMMEHARHGTAETEPVDVNSFVDEYVNLAYHGRRASTPDFDVTLNRRYADDTGIAPIIRQDFSRVLINLIGNAFDAVSSVDPGDAQSTGLETRPTVTIETRRESIEGGNGARVVIEISDNGPGVPAAVKEKVFEPFFTTKPTGQGTGLGLSLSYDIVTAGHGGTLSLKDQVGGGARFVISLPTWNNQG